MSERAQALAERFEQINGEMIAFAEGCDEATWQTLVPEEQRTVGVVIHHVVSAYPVVGGWITSLAAGQPVAITREQIDHLNDRHKERFAHPDRGEVVTLLRSNGAAASEFIRSLDDAQLDGKAPFGPAGGRPLSAARVAEEVYIGHPSGHLAGLRKALGQ